MHESTYMLFEELKKSKTKADFMEKLLTYHKQVKHQIASTGLEFYNLGENFSESIKGGQIISGDVNISKVFFYEELNYIKHGLTINWYTNLENTDRYSTIKNLTLEIANKLE